MDLKQKIFETGKNIQLANLASITLDGKPWVRYVMGMLDKDLNFRTSAMLSSRKIKQIENNPDVHIILGVTDVLKPDQWIQIEGTAEIKNEKNERHTFWNDSLKAVFTGPDDPNYGIIIVKPAKIELEKFGVPTPEVWESS